MLPGRGNGRWPTCPRKTSDRGSLIGVTGSDTPHPRNHRVVTDVDDNPPENEVWLEAETIAYRHRRFRASDRAVEGLVRCRGADGYRLAVHRDRALIGEVHALDVLPQQEGQVVRRQGRCAGPGEVEETPGCRCALQFRPGLTLRLCSR